MGPSTGLPTRTSQGDMLAVYFLGHGDSRHVVLLPGNVEECFEFGWRAFDLAERLQTPVFVLSDLDLGMNLWMSEPFDYPDQPMDRGKVLSAEELNELRRLRALQDVDGDGIGWRTLPGTDHPLAAYFTRGTRPQRAGASYTRAPGRLGRRTWQRLERKLEPRARSSQRPWSTRWPAPRSASSPTARPIRRWSKPRDRWRAAASRRVTCGCARCRSTDDYAQLRRERIRASTSSRTTSTARWRSILMTECAEARRHA